MSADIALVQAYLANMQFALHNLDVPCAETLLAHVVELLAQPCPVLATSDIRSKIEGYWYLYPFLFLVIST